LQSISVAQKPISLNPTFPNLPDVESLKLSQTGISKLDDTLLNLEILEILESLDVGGNCIRDFDFIDLLAKLEFLTDIDLCDAKFGRNPVCSLPN
jgi:hypothetical protein